jgi:hypothetical protein
MFPTRRAFAGLTVLFFLATTAVPLAEPTPARTTTASVAAGTTTSLPIAFELNEGQAQPGIKALARGKGYGLLVTEQSFVVALTPGAKGPEDVLRFTTIGSDPAASVTGLEPLPGTVSYFVGNDPGKWRSGIRTYARIKVHSVYPGIDLIHYGNQQQFEYDFVVAPGADPSAIRFAISGATHVGLEPTGDLALVTKHGTVVHRKPVIYQDFDGTRHAIEGRFVVGARSEVSFAVGEYDRRHPLVIDPTIAMFGYFGGAGADQIRSIAVTSPSGLTFFGGLTTSPTLTGAANTFGGGATDAFISVMNSNGTSVLLTLFLGGVSTETLSGVALDPASVPAFLVVTGTTDSSNFPILNAEQPAPGGSFDVFVTRFNISIAGGIPSATIAYSTFLGGASADIGTGVAVSTSATGSVTFVTGSTLSPDFPTANAIQPNHGGAFDGFVAKFSPNGTLLFSTFLGGAASEQASGVAIFNQPSPPAALPFVTGTVTLAENRSRAFLFALDGAGTTARYAKVFGADTALTTSNGIAVDTGGNAYITGETTDAALPVVAAVQSTYGGNGDAYVAKFNPTGATVFATYAGGAGVDKSYGIAVDTFTGGTNNIIIAGLTSGSFPVTAMQTTFGGIVDAFVMLLKGGASYSVGYATYLGGPGIDAAFSVCVGSAHNARVAGITNSPGRATPGVAQPTIAGGFDGFVTRINTTP